MPQEGLTRYGPALLVDPHREQRPSPLPSRFGLANMSPVARTSTGLPEGGLRISSLPLSPSVQTCLVVRCWADDTTPGTNSVGSMPWCAASSPWVCSERVWVRSTINRTHSGTRVNVRTSSGSSPGILRRHFLAGPMDQANTVSPSSPSSVAIEVLNRSGGWVSGFSLLRFNDDGTVKVRSNRSGAVRDLPQAAWRDPAEAGN